MRAPTNCKTRNLQSQCAAHESFRSSFEIDKFSSAVVQGRWNRKWAREAAKWGADFMAKSVDEDQVLLHIGDIRKDHNYIGRAEYYPNINRNILFCPTGPPLLPFRILLQFCCATDAISNLCQSCSEVSCLISISLRTVFIVCRQVLRCIRRNCSIACPRCNHIQAD